MSRANIFVPNVKNINPIMTEKNHNIEAVGGERKYLKPKTEILPLTAEAREYLTNVRGIRLETLEAYRVGCNKRGEIVIPFFDEKDELNLVKFRDAKGKMLKRRRKNDDGSFDDYSVKTDIEKGGKPVLLGSHLCDEREGSLIICFGDYDAMTVSQDGVPNCVSLPFGDKGFGFLDTQWNFLEKFPEIIIYPDNDQFDNPAAELRAAKKLDELANRLGKYRCRLVRKEDLHGAKDANELLLKKGVGANLAAINNADWFPSGIVAVADYVEPPSAEGIPTGRPDIDKATGGFGGGQLVIVSGDNGAGKTTEVLNWTANFIEEDAPVFFWTGEQKVGKIRYWFERIAAGEDYLRHVVGEKTGFDFYFPKEEVIEAIKHWYRNYLFQLNKTGIEAQEFFESAELAVRRFGCRFIVIDNLMAFTGGEGEGYYQAQGDFAQSCKHFAEKWDVCVILICHNRKSEQTGKNYRLPGKDDVEGSKKVTNWADVVIQMVRVPEAFQFKFGGADSLSLLCKNREGGVFEDIRLCFERKSNRLCQMSESWRMNKDFGWVKWMDKYNG